MDCNDDEFYLFSNVVVKESQLEKKDEKPQLKIADSESISGNPIIKSSDMNTSLIIHTKDNKQNMNDDNNTGVNNDSKNIENDKVKSENSQTSPKKKKNKRKKNKKQNPKSIENEDNKNTEEDSVTDTISPGDTEKKKRKFSSELIEPTETETTNIKKKRKKNNKKNKNNQKTKEQTSETKLEEEVVEEEEGEEEKKEDKTQSKKQNRNIIKNNRQISFFVGQIPYDCKEDQIRKHFEKNGIEVKDIRMLNKDDGSFKGCCFLHVPATQKEKTSKLHHSFLNNRQINVTLDPKSLGLTSKTSKDIMKVTIKKIRNDADKTTEEIMSETLQNIMNKAKGSVGANDIDKKSLTALCSLPTNLSERLINDFSRLNFAGVKNINAYLMGMIKKYRTKYIPISKK